MRHIVSNERPTAAAPAEEGFLLLGLIVAIALLLLALGAAATSEAVSIRRDREAEAVRRGDQYVRAIRLYYKKFGHYPGSIEQLDKSNNIRFLRRRWIDPLTGTTDWRTIAVGQNKTTPKAFFGEPLAGIANSGLGSLAGAQSAGMPGSPTAPGGAAASAAGAGGFGSGLVNPVATASPAGSGASPATDGTGTAAAGGAGTSSPGGVGSTPAGGGGAFMGVGTNATGNSLVEVNGESTYQGWEFLYDPRVEQLRLKQQLNSGMQGTAAGAFGQAPATDTSKPAAPVVGQDPPPTQ